LEAFWNSGERENIMGLDILGLRQVDQNIEKIWVSGITTISFRARYMSLLPWLLGEYRRSGIAGEQASTEYEEEEVLTLLRRTEFVVLACSRLAAKEESGSLTGILGTDLFAEDLETLRERGRVKPPDDRGGASLGTYVMPCSAVGILQTGDAGEPVRVTPRGQEFYLARSAALKGSKLVAAILKGGAITKADIDSEGQHFSVNALRTAGKERQLLEDALLKPFVDDRDLRVVYERFAATSSWAFRRLERKASQAEDLIVDAYRASIQPQSGLRVVEWAWAEYEFRRRIHFALELLLSAFTDELIPLVQGTVDEVVNRWSERTPLAEVVEEFTGWGKGCASEQIRSLTGELPSRAFLEDGLWGRDARDLAPRSRAVYSVALMLATGAQSTNARNARKFKDRGTALEKTLALLSASAKDSLASVLNCLLTEIIIPAHLATSLRKMGQGQKCSLRFFPEGRVLRSTGKAVIAGYSGDRLRNVLGIWADIGALDRTRDGFSLTDRGRALSRALRSAL